MVGVGGCVFLLKVCPSMGLGWAVQFILFPQYLLFLMAVVNMVVSSNPSISKSNLAILKQGTIHHSQYKTPSSYQGQIICTHSTYTNDCYKAC